jgi:tRNA A37 threonylcarbamoyladenosine synthetase subunit TsaC/SUA5/YrdC
MFGLACDARDNEFMEAVLRLRRRDIDFEQPTMGRVSNPHDPAVKGF